MRLKGTVGHLFNTDGLIIHDTRKTRVIKVNTCVIILNAQGIIVKRQKGESVNHKLKPERVKMDDVLQAQEQSNATRLKCS